MKGLIFTAEVLIAVGIFSSFLLFLFITTFERTSPYDRYERMHIMNGDALALMNQLRVIDLKDSNLVLQDLIDSGEITDSDFNSSIIEVVGMFWSAGKTDIARDLVSSVLQDVVPGNMNYAFYIGDDIIFQKSSGSEPSQVTTVNRLVSGFQSDKVVKGFISKAEIKKIKLKGSSSFSYFGGFVGQGNITEYIRDIPSDANITSIYLELSVGSDFNLNINGNFCSDFHKQATGTFPVDKWTVTDQSCLNAIIPGIDNKFDIVFTNGGIPEQFIAGGFIEVKYDTSEMAPTESNTTRYTFPGISGVLNLYDSFYLPGTLDTSRGMNMHIHYKNNLATDMFLVMGDKEMFRNNATGEQSFTISYNNILSKFGSAQELSDFVSSKTIPLRFGTSSFDVYVTKGIADVMLITDVSISMDQNTVQPGNLQKLAVAKNVSKLFVDSVLNYSGNRVGLIAYSSYYPAIRWWHDLTNDSDSLKSQIDSYSRQSSTCISCGINTSHEVLLHNSTPSKFRGMLVMSDGIANTCMGQNPWIGETGAGCGEARAKREAVNEACKARADNLTVFSVAFGTDADTATLKRIACWDCSKCAADAPDNPNCWIGQVQLQNGSMEDCLSARYAGSNDYGSLIQIYKRFAEYFGSVGYTTQKVNVTGGIPVGNYLYPDSYIEFNYNPEVPSYGYGDVSLNFETDPLGGCNGSFYIPPQLTVDNVRMTSYSSDYWTKNLFVNSSATGGNWLNVFELSDYGTDYTKLGDPFSIQFSPQYISPGEENGISLLLGTSPLEYSSTCSQDDKLFYTAHFKAVTSYSPPLPKAEGHCVVVYYDKNFDGAWDGNITLNIGENPNPPCIGVDELNMTNSVDYAFMQLLRLVNFISQPGLPGTMSNPIQIVLSDDVLVDVRSISNIPSLWGPLKFRMDVWS